MEILEKIGKYSSIKVGMKDPESMVEMLDRQGELERRKETHRSILLANGFSEADLPYTMDDIADGQAKKVLQVVYDSVNKAILSHPTNLVLAGKMNECSIPATIIAKKACMYGHNCRMEALSDLLSTCFQYSNTLKDDEELTASYDRVLYCDLLVINHFEDITQSEAKAKYVATFLKNRVSKGYPTYLCGSVTRDGLSSFFGEKNSFYNVLDEHFTMLSLKDMIKGVSYKSKGLLEGVGK